MPVPEVDMNKWGDRCAASGPLTDAVLSPVAPTALKPIAIAITSDEVAALYAAQKGDCDPNLFNQYLLERFKAFGAPVEGTVRFKLAHGAIARVKPDATQKQLGFQYLWLPAEYAVAIAQNAVSAA